MALSTMYPAMPGSPKTALTAQIAANATSATVDDISALPAAPNICVLGDSTSAEIVSYTGISGSTLTGLVRGLGGTTASVWATDTVVARNFTSFDHDRFKLNIESLAGEINDVVASDFDSTANYSIGDYVIKEGALYRFTSAHPAGAWDADDATAVTVGGELKSKANASALSSYAPLASPSLTGTPTAPSPSFGDDSTKIATTAWVHDEFGSYAPLASPALTGTPTAPTAATNTNTTQIATTAFVKKNGLVYGQGTLNQGTTKTFSNPDITADMYVINCRLSVPSYVTSDIGWTTAAGSITFTGTFAASCVIYFTLGTPTVLTLT